MTRSTARSLAGSGRSLPSRARTLSDRIQGLSLVVPSQDAVQEVKLATSNYDAEYGKVAGGLWQITTKSGTNAFRSDSGSVASCAFAGRRAGSQTRNQQL